MSGQLHASYMALHPNEPKPAFPYAVGRVIHAQPHLPPTPIYRYFLLDYYGGQERRSIHPIQRCLRHPPPTGHTGEGSISFEIVELLRAADGNSAQILLVDVNPADLPSTLLDRPPNSQTLVAKIYDPLYIDHEQDNYDPLKTAPTDYAFEVSAYRQLQPLYGTLVPHYYGSYTCNMPVEVEQHMQARSVRLILLSRLPGESLINLNPENYSQSERQKILGTLIDAESTIYKNNIEHRDIHPRNIIIAGHPGKPDFHLYVIDFASVYLGRASPEMLAYTEDDYLPGVYISPLLRWTEYVRSEELEAFADWIDWSWQPWLEERYQATRNDITEQMKSLWLLEPS